MSEMNDVARNGRNGRRQTDPVIEGRPDPQVVARPTRRSFTAAYKLRILKEADTCTHHGDLGELLRREGLYSSTLTSFRKQQQAGRLNGADPETRRAQRKQNEAARQRDARRIARLESENQKLRALLDLQKKLSDLIGVPLLTEPRE
jgi:transposase-like protein